jgi:glycosyltransferase involved in cell wall biosynthesis
MKQKTIVLSVNAAWNIVNFRMGLVRALQGAGYEVVALAPDDASAALLGEAGVPFEAIEMDRQGVSPRRDLALLWRYRRALARIRPDLFLGFTAKPNVYGSLAARSLGIKVINNVSGLGTAFIRQGLLTKIVSGLYRIAFRGSSTVFFQNDEDRALFVGKGIVAEGKTRLLPGSGVDLARFAPGPQRVEDGEFRFLLVARLLWDKGVREFIEAARIVKAQAPAARFQLLGFLDVANQTAVSRAEVEAWVAEGLVEYLGAVEDVRPAIAQAECVVLPSYREGLPRTLLEAGAMGKPLIATDVPGCRDVVGHKANGLLCAVRDPRALADAMLAMLAAPEAVRSGWGAAARAGIETRFDERIVTGLYLDAIEEALAPRD